MNTITLRIYDFLKGYPPFNMLSRAQLLEVCAAIEVRYIEEGNHIFSLGEAVGNYFYVVKDGAIGLFADKDQLVDKCDEGDIFGLRAIIRKGEYVLGAKALEESIVYSLPTQVFKTYFAEHPKVNAYLMASFAANVHIGNTSSDSATETAQVPDFTEEQTADYSKSPITCSPETMIQEAARIMTQNRVGSIVVVGNNEPLGIITDKDLRTKVATGEFGIAAKVKEIMSAPVITFPENITVAEAQIAMLQHGITHLCITEDGTPNSRLTGILSEHDIIVVREHSASALVKEVKRARNTAALAQIGKRAQALLKRYLDQDMPIGHVSKIISAITDSIAKRAIELSLEAMGKEPPVPFAWLMLGSQGRGEQLLHTDQDNALVFKDVEDADQTSVQAYFLELANKVTLALHQIGYAYCPAKMMASNPQWCLPLSQWKDRFAGWITRPDQDKLMLCTIFFDFKMAYGDKSLVDALVERIFEAIGRYDVFLNYLGVNALQNPPPLGFFRQFLVEQAGDHKNQFDIKARTMMPLVDAARLLILSYKTNYVNNTIGRYQLLKEMEPQNERVYTACIEAYKTFLLFRTKAGLANNDSGRFVDIDALDKSDRLKLKESFKAIKEVQELIRIRFKLAQLM